jgi:hypothetical protein
MTDAEHNGNEDESTKAHGRTQQLVQGPNDEIVINYS